MKIIDVFYQGEGLSEIGHFAIEADATFAIVKAKLSKKYDLAADVLLFAEDKDSPLDDKERISDHAGDSGLKLHFSSCHRIKVYITFNGATVDHEFAPGTTISSVKRWTTESAFKMSAEDAGEHVLQITGTHDRPAPSAHVGALAPRKTCAVSFDLVPDERVNGALEGDA